MLMMGGKALLSDWWSWRFSQIFQKLRMALSYPL